MHLARNHADPDYRTRGAFGGPHMVALTSEHAHYSYLKAAFLTGAATHLGLLWETCFSHQAIAIDQLGDVRQTLPATLLYNTSSVMATQ